MVSPCLRFVLAVVIGISLSFGFHAGNEADIGSLPQLKVNKARVELGKKTLADVVVFYNRGGGNDKNKDPRMKRLGLL